MPTLEQDLLDFIGYSVFGIFLTLIAVSGLTLLWRYTAIRSRYREQGLGPGDGHGFELAELGFDQTRRSSELSTRINRWVARLVDNPKYGARLRQKLMLAGIFNPDAVGLFLAARAGLALVLPVLLAAAIQLFTEGTSPLLAFGLPIALAVLGLLMPDYYVSRRTSAYADECRRAFPDFLDLLVVATDAGMGLEQAIGRVGSEIIKSYPSFGASLYLMTLELRMGRGFGEALNNFVGRSQVDEIRSFATLLQQSRELGSSVTAALRIYSEDMRHKRMSNAEEKAHALPVKIVIPLGVFLFPVIIMIVMLPVAIRIGEAVTKLSR